MNQSNFWLEVLQQSMINIRLYLGAEFKVLVVIFILYALGLTWIGYEGAVWIAAGISLMDLFPVLGSGMIYIPWAVYEWIWGTTSSGWWLIALYIVGLIAKQVMEPVFLGKGLDLPAWLPLVVTLVCSLVFNVFGILVAAILLPVIAAIKQVAQRREII